MRLGIFGGSFDPVHLGHLLLAEYCREAARLDQVWFVPAALPPHKQEQQLAPAADRVQMLRLAIGGHRSFEVWTHEIDRGGVSYTYETLQHLRDTRPDDELFLLMGADSLEDLPRWRQPATVLALASPVVVGRAGSHIAWEPLARLVDGPRLESFARLAVTMPLIELSSTDMRRRVRQGLSICYQTTRAVEKYIETARLYQ